MIKSEIHQTILTGWKEMPRDGHFAAMEEPEKFVEEIRDFYRPLRRTAPEVIKQFHSRERAVEEAVRN